MRPERVRYLRRLLKMSEAEMAMALRMPGAEGESIVRRWEDGKRLLSGPASLALMYLSQGGYNDVMKNVVPEYIQAKGLGRGWNPPEFVLRLWAPRFIAIVLLASEPDRPPDAEWVWIQENEELLATIMWIDDPAVFRVDPKELLREAASLFWDENCEPESEDP